MALGRVMAGSRSPDSVGFIRCAALSVAALWRSGTAHAALGARAILRRLLPRLESAFPRAKIRVRADAGFATPKVYDYLERKGLEYVIGFPNNKKLAKLTQPLLQRARAKSAASGESARVYSDTLYQADTWPRQRRLIIKAEVTRSPGRRAVDVTPRSIEARVVQAPVCVCVA